MTRRAAGQGGYSLIELIVFGSVAAWALYLVAPWFQKGNSLVRKVTLADFRGRAMQSIDLLVSDLEEADPNSINWNSIPPQSAVNWTDFGFSKSSIDLSNPANPTSKSYRYTYNPGTASLLRIENPFTV